MRSRRIKPAFILAFPFALLLLLGCGANAQTKAIANAVIAYSDYYIEVRNLSDQVRAQNEQTASSAKSVNYVISADIPDYSKIDLASVGFTLPEADVSLRSASAYEKKAALALRQALEQYVMQNGAESYLTLPVTFSVSADQGIWSANMTSQSKLDIQKTVENMMLALLQTNGTYQSDYRRMQATSALPVLLADVFGGKEYAETIEINDVALPENGGYSVSFSYPDAAFVYGALADAYVASFNQNFYGSERMAELDTEGLKDIPLSGAPRKNASVRLSFDDTAQTFSLLDDGGLAATIAEEKSRAEQSASAAVNGQWRVEPLDLPGNGSVLEGESRGNQIIFKAGASLGSYFYVRFYAITGEDTSEEGVLQLGVFIVGGKSAKVKLPAGYYRVTCLAGENWYGLEQLFGSDMKTYTGKNAIRSRDGYVNNISFE